MEAQRDLFGQLIEAFENDDLTLLAQHYDSEYEGYDKPISEAQRRFGEPEPLPEMSEAEYLRLADGLLEATIREAFGESRGGRPFRESRSAFQWLLYDEPLDDGYPFSYRNCCKAAGVDPDELREQLIYMKHRLT